MTHPIHPVATLPTLPVKTGGEASMGCILMELGKLKPIDIDRVLAQQQANGMRFGETARRMGLISEDDIQQVLARQFDYHYLPPGQGKYPPELVAAYQPFSAQMESLRTVRAELMQRWFARGRKVLVVAGIGQGDGASFFAANLGVAISQLGQRTLLIDANLRRPRQHEIFNLKGRQGLSDILASRAGMETFSKVECFAHLSVLPAGTRPPNPQELLNRSSFGELRESLGNRFDAILIDVPAFSAGADALTIAERAGGVLLVCRNNKTALADVNAVGAQLARADVEVVGSVLVDF